MATGVAANVLGRYLVEVRQRLHPLFNEVGSKSSSDSISNDNRKPEPEYLIEAERDLDAALQTWTVRYMALRVPKNAIAGQQTTLVCHDNAAYRAICITLQPIAAILFEGLPVEPTALSILLVAEEALDGCLRGARDFAAQIGVSPTSLVRRRRVWHKAFRAAAAEISWQSKLTNKDDLGAFLKRFLNPNSDTNINGSNSNSKSLIETACGEVKAQRQVTAFDAVNGQDYSLGNTRALTMPASFQRAVAERQQITQRVTNVHARLLKEGESRVSTWSGGSERHQLDVMIEKLLLNGDSAESLCDCSKAMLQARYIARFAKRGPTSCSPELGEDDDISHSEEEEYLLGFSDTEVETRSQVLPVTNNWSRVP